MTDETEVLPFGEDEKNGTNLWGKLGALGSLWFGNLSWLPNQIRPWGRLALWVGIIIMFVYVPLLVGGSLLILALWRGFRSDHSAAKAAGHGKKAVFILLGLAMMAGSIWLAATAGQKIYEIPAAVQEAAERWQDARRYELRVQTPSLSCDFTGDVVPEECR